MNTELNTTEELELALDILEYFCNNQEAKDTMKGIPYWLKDSSAVISPTKVERAVSLLLSNQLILEIRREGLEPFYRMNEKKRDQILTLLQKHNNK